MTNMYFLEQPPRKIDSPRKEIKEEKAVEEGEEKTRKRQGK